MKLYNPAPYIDLYIPFGIYRDRDTNELSNSLGQVYDGTFGASVAQDGIIEETGYNDDLGYHILIKHAPDLYTFYAGGSEVFDSELIKEDQRVGVGQRIFTTGIIGNIKRPGLYYEARRERDGGQVDPFSFMNPYGIMPGVETPEQQHLAVDGVLGEKTWKAWQEALKMNRTWQYYGITDGIPGDLTYAAIKNSVEMMYDGTSIDPDEVKLIKAVQRKLAEKGHYQGEETGEFDPETVAALQRALNYAEYR